MIYALTRQLIDWLVLLCFSVFSPIPLFWIPVHGAIRFLRRFRGRTYWYALVVWLFSAWLFLGNYDFWFGSRFARRWWTWAAGFGLLAVEVAVMRRVGSILGLNRLIGRSELDPERFAGSLMQHGIYARVRHPRYSAAMGALFGLALAGGSWRLLAAAAASVPLYYLMTALEERELAARFGEEYRAYRRRVPRFFPRLR